jgi:acetyltransferase-like isoleucine patch superfamily enzyme
MNLIDAKRVRELASPRVDVPLSPAAPLPANLRLGRDVWIEHRSSFAAFRSECRPGCTLGDRVRVYGWTMFHVEPEGAIEVGDDTLLVGPAFLCAGRIRIGRRVVISYGVTIADCDFHPLDPLRRRFDVEASSPFGDPGRRPALDAHPVAIEDDAWIGIGAIVLKGVRIGYRARVGPGAVVTADVPPGALVRGNPARIVGGVEDD